MSNKEKAAKISCLPTLLVARIGSRRMIVGLKLPGTSYMINGDRFYAFFPSIRESWDQQSLDPEARFLV